MARNALLSRITPAPTTSARCCTHPRPRAFLDPDRPQLTLGWRISPTGGGSAGLRCSWPSAPRPRSGRSCSSGRSHCAYASCQPGLAAARQALLAALVLAADSAARPGRPGRAELAVLRDKPYALISFLNVIMLLRIPIISLANPLWIIERTDTGEDGVVAARAEHPRCDAVQARVTGRAPGRRGAHRASRRDT